MFLVSRSQLSSTCALDSACRWQIDPLKAHSIHGTGVSELKLFKFVIIRLTYIIAEKVRAVISIEHSESPVRERGWTQFI